jgi:hypothetical protein
LTIQASRRGSDIAVYRVLASVFAALAALALWLFPSAAQGVQVLLGFCEGAGFAGALTVANLLIIERRPRAEWNVRLGWLETTLSVGQAGAHPQRHRAAPQHRVDGISYYSDIRGHMLPP